jgi:hypothetical protein
LSHHSHFVELSSRVVNVALVALLLQILKMGQVLRRLLEVFYTKKLDIVVIGLENRYEICEKNSKARLAPALSYTVFLVERRHFYRYWLMANLLKQCQRLA